MMSETSVKSLLRIMTIRHSMHVEGKTRPHASAVNATKQLVEKLAQLDPTEAIDVAVLAENPLHAQYIRAKTGERLAEIQIEDEASSGADPTAV